MYAVKGVFVCHACDGKVQWTFSSCEHLARSIREVTDVPAAVGFGISTPEQAVKMAAASDGAIVGSAIVKIIEKYGDKADDAVREYVKSMKDALKTLK